MKEIACWKVRGSFEISIIFSIKAVHEDWVSSLIASVPQQWLSVTYVAPSGRVSELRSLSPSPTSSNRVGNFGSDERDLLHLMCVFLQVLSHDKAIFMDELDDVVLDDSAVFGTESAR